MAGGARRSPRRDGAPGPLNGPAPPRPRPPEEGPPGPSGAASPPAAGTARRARPGPPPDRPGPPRTPAPAQPPLSRPPGMFDSTSNTSADKLTSPGPGVQGLGLEENSKESFESR